VAPVQVLPHVPQVDAVVFAVQVPPQQMLPAPRIRGNVTSVRIEGDQVIQVFGSGPAPGRRLLPYAQYRNYMYFRGGNLRFGKLTMTGADLALIDEDPKDPFDFNLDRYNDQLVAGYSKNTPSRGLKTFMPDADDLAARTARRPAPRDRSTRNEAATPRPKLP